MQALTQLAIIWTAVFVAVVAARATRLTSVLFFLFLGFVLVNLGWLPHKAHPFIQEFAELGLIVIMFALGFEESTSNFLHSIRKSWGIALFGALSPFLAAYLIADFFWQDTQVSLMCGLAMTATAVSLTMVSLRSEGLQNSAAATRIMTSAVLDDIGSLTMVAIVVSIVTGDGNANPAAIAWILIKVVIFFTLVWITAAWLLPHDPRGWAKKVPLLKTYGLRHLFVFGGRQYTTLTVLLLAVGAGLLSQVFGFHQAVGAYMAGLIMHESYFERGLEFDSFEETKTIIESVAFSWIGPVFFVHLGTFIVLDWELMISIIPETLVLLTALFATQILSAALAAKYTSGMDWSNSWLIGFGMLGRAELAFVVMNIAYIETSIFSIEVFYTLMFTAFWLNVSVPVTIRLWKRHMMKPQIN